MDRTALHLEIRNALSITDELSRYEHALGNDELTAHLSSLRTCLDELERDLGRSHDSARAVQPKPQTVDSVERTAVLLRLWRDDIPGLLQPRFASLVASAERVAYGLSRPYAPVPAKPLLGALPLARVIPQDVHSAFDFLCAGALMTSARLARTPAARAVGMTLGLGDASVSMLTDHRLGVAKLVPIEVYEVADYVTGVACVVAPFALGYARKDPIASAIQVLTGVGLILTSLFTDYRAANGVTIPMRSKGGPDAEGAEIPRARLASGEGGQRVREVQKPLEGLSSAPTDWRPDMQWPGAR
jgi:hypothetical protein